MHAVTIGDDLAAMPPLVQPSDAARFRRRGEELEALKDRTIARMGEEDLRHVARVNRFSRAMEVAGRVFIFASPEPITFLIGVGALWVHKQLQAAEIGHSALHGAWDGIPGAEAFASKTFRWDMPIDEASWRHEHNVKHHGNTNVAGKDPDIRFGTIRLTDKTPHRGYHRRQLAVVLTPRLSQLRVLHRVARVRPHRRILRQRAAERHRRLARPVEGERPRRLAQGPAQVRPLLPLQLRALPRARRPVLLEGAPRQLARRDGPRRLLGGDHLLRPRRPRREELPGGDARADPRSSGTRCRSRRPPTSR